jgi:hypothetical protein
MTNKERFLAGEEFILPSIRSGKMNFTPPDSDDGSEFKGSIRGTYADGGNLT